MSLKKTVSAIVITIAKSADLFVIRHPGESRDPVPRLAGSKTLDFCFRRNGGIASARIRQNFRNRYKNRGRLRLSPALVGVGLRKTSQESGCALNRVTLGGPEATASGRRRHKRFTDQLQKISQTVILTGPSSPHILSLRDPDEVSSGPPTGSSCHDLSQTFNHEIVSESLLLIV